MTRTHFLKSLALAGMLAIGGSAIAMAQPTHGASAPSAEGRHEPGHWGHRGRGFFFRRVLQRLDLSDAQQAQVRSIMKDTRANAQRTRDLPREDRRAAMRDLRQDTMRRIRAVLTDAQRAKLDAMKAQWKAHRFDRRPCDGDQSGKAS